MRFLERSESESNVVDRSVDPTPNSLTTPYETSRKTMPSIVTRRAIPRRRFLRGAGAVALGLPLLDAMRPTLGQQLLAADSPPPSPPPRFVAVCATLGFHTPFLFPESADDGFTATPYLKPLAKQKDSITAISGLSHPNQQGNNGHASETTWLTAAERPGLAGFKNTVSIDQLIAEKIGIQTRLPYLALSTSGRSMSWSAAGVEIPSQSSAAKLFKELFVEGTPTEVEAEVRNIKRNRSILDTVGEQAKKLETELGRHDRDKLDEYLSAVRDLETRLQESQDWAKRPKPKVDAELPRDVEDRNDAIAKQKLMFDMIVLALQTDSTRTITFQLGGLSSAPTIPGVSNEWHGLSHHGKDPKKIEELRLIEEAEFQALGRFLDKLASIEEEGKSLLDHTAVLYGSNLGNASSHSAKNLPIIVAGGGYRHQGYVAHDAEDNTHFANLLLDLGQRMGVEKDAFGSSTSAGIAGLERA